ncbi:MAG: hypothetical protein OEN56_15210 [Gemmatimonadota bacterium]|nr:hypothetical protein [Gemmatimonadota bacterium]
MKSTVRYLALTGMVVLAACGDDGLTAGTLSAAEAEELAGAIFSQSFLSALTLNYDQPAQSPEGPQLATYTTTIETTASCPLGGLVAVDAFVDVAVDDQTGAGDVDFSVDLTHSGCVVQGQNGTEFSLTGNPGILFNFLMSTDGGENASFSGSITGAVDFGMVGVEKQGMCQISYDFSGTSSQQGFSFQASGSVCSNNVSQSFSID